MTVSIRIEFAVSGESPSAAYAEFQQTLRHLLDGPDEAAAAADAFLAATTPAPEVPKSKAKKAAIAPPPVEEPSPPVVPSAKDNETRLAAVIDALAGIARSDADKLKTISDWRNAQGLRQLREAGVEHLPALETMLKAVSL